MRRLAAMIYDWVAMLALVMVVGMICQVATHGQLIGTGAQVVTPWWYLALQYLVVAAYFVVSWRLGGQTLGMRPWRMRLRMVNGKPLRLPATILRAAVVSLPLLVHPIGHDVPPEVAMWTALIAWFLFFVVALFNRRRRALHDLAAGTEIVHAVTPRRSRRRRGQASPDANRNA